MHYEGTAAQLADEGLIPQGLSWPQAAADKRWQANGYSYWLRRCRPKAHKGPMRSWLELDHWFLRVYVVAHDFEWRWQRELQRKAESLRADIYFHSALGAQECSAKWHRYWKAQEDEAFQTFKKLIPGLVPPARGRKAKSQTTQGEQA